MHRRFLSISGAFGALRICFSPQYTEARRQRTQSLYPMRVAYVSTTGLFCFCFFFFHMQTGEIFSGVVPAIFQFLNYFSKHVIAGTALVAFVLVRFFFI